MSIDAQDDRFLKKSACYLNTNTICYLQQIFSWLLPQYFKLSECQILIMNQLAIENRSKTQSFILQFLFGGIAAFVSKTVASPIEVVKLRLQTQYALIQRGHLIQRYEGIFDCFKRLHAQGGIAAYFKGNGTNALRFFLTQALNFSFRDLFRNLEQQKRGKDKNNFSFATNIIAGGAAGASTQVIVYPLDYARTRLANQVTLKNRKDQVVFNGLVDCLKKTYKTDGIIGLYRGFIVSCFCMVIYRGLYFGIYDTLRPFLPKKYEQNMLITFSLGYLATITSGACSYPLDTVRRRMMMTSGEIVKFKGSWQCMQKIWNEGGWRAFFRGGMANIVGGVTGAAVFSFYDKMKVQYEQKYRTF